MFETLVRAGGLRGRSVLDLGCGTGRLAAALAVRAGCSVTAVDPSPEMLAVARSHAATSARFERAEAEALPFRAARFERVTARLVVHLVDLRRALAEARRVLRPDGRVVIATFDSAHFGDFWLNRLFPSLEGIDRARFPGIPELESELRSAGFGATGVTRLVQHASLVREEALERIRGRHISTFDLLAEEEYRTGLDRAEHELPARVDYRLEWAVVVALV